MSQTRLLAAELELVAAADLLSRAAEVRDRGESSLEFVFLDSADRRLRAAGLDVVHDQGWLQLRSRTDGGTLARSRLRELNGPLRLVELSPSAFADRVGKIVGERALMPLVRVRLQARMVDVLDEMEKTVVRVELQAGEARCLPQDTGVELDTAIQLRAMRGYLPELSRLQSLLLEASGVTLALEPLADQALRACGGDPAGLSSKVNVALTPELRADSAAAAVLRRLLEVIEDNLRGAREDIDPEFLHDLRVAVRRTRSVQRELRGVFPAAELAHHRAAFRWLQQATGEVRDLDVQLGELPELQALVPEAIRADLDPVRDVLDLRRERARSRLVADLSGHRTQRTLRDWAALLEDLVELPSEGRPNAATPIGDLIAARVAKVHRRMVKMGREIEDRTPAESLHELRKRGKELRYLLELFATRLGPENVVTPMIKSLKGLQDVLGRHQDRQVQIELLRSITDEVARRGGAAQALIAMGALLGALHEDELAARREFAARFDAFASPTQRKMVREAFG